MRRADLMDDFYDEDDSTPYTVNVKDKKIIPEIEDIDDPDQFAVQYKGRSAKNANMMI